MATLRDPLFGLDNAPSAEWQAAEAEAARPNSLRGGWEAGRIGSERNALGIDELAARAAGDIQRAETLRMQNDALGQAQARVAPEVQRVEDIDSIGTGLNWLGGQVGQGVASMAEPVAAATALGGIGRVAGMLPGTAGKVGRAIGTVGAPAAALGINQRQMAGEFANDAMQDQELMARTSPQDLYRTANVVGGVAGLADTVLPGVIGHQLTGGALRAGMKAAGAGMGPAAKTGLGMLGEGATELGQGEVGRYALGQLNPNRGTGSDNSDRLNEAAGGAAGGGPLIAAGAYADAGYRRVGQAADMVGTKTGELVDLAKEKYEGSALQGGVDKVVAAGKRKAGDLIDLARGDDGQISLTKLADTVREGADDLVQRYKVSAEERDILEGVPPEDVAADPVKYDAWNAENTGKRMNFIAQRLDQMAENDPRAAELFDRLANEQDPVAQEVVAQEASKHILETNEIEQLASRGERAAAAMGEMASKGASALGKGAVAVGKGAMKFGKAVFDGASAEARKKNAQGGDYAAQGYEAWLERTGRAATERVVQGAKNSPAASQVKRRGEVFGEMLATETQAALAARGFDAQRMNKVTGLLRDVGYDLAHLSSKGGPQGPGAALTVGRIANTLRTALGARAEGVVGQLQALADPKAAKMFEQLSNEIANGRSFSGRQQAEQVRNATANQLVAMLPAADMQEVMRSEAAGGKLNRHWLLDTIEGLANGHESPQLRKALEQKFGPEAVGQMLALVGDELPAPTTVYGAGADYDAREREDGEKKVEKGSGPKVYGFAKTAGQSLRGSTDRRDPFSPVSKMSPSEALAFKDENLQRKAEGLEPLAGAPVKRPGLFKLTDTLFAGGNALEKKLADMEAATEKTGHRVSAQSALEVMQGLNFQPAKILSVYRDYLRQDAGNEGLSDAERKALAAMANKANRAVLDAMDQEGEGKTAYRLSAGDRKQIAEAAEAYFKERYVAVAEQLSDAVPDRIELTELLSMGRDGAKAVAFARGQGDQQFSVLDEANLITFQSDLLKNKDRGLHVRADTLVNWVRAQRARNETKADAKEDNSNRAKNQAYLDDLLEGITAVTTSGAVVEKMPTRINAKGEYESFAKSIPPSLRLVTSTYGAMMKGKAQRAEARGRVEDPLGPNEEDVAQDQARNEEFFVADPLEGLEPEPAASRAQGQTMTAEEEGQFAALNTAKERREFLKGLGLKKSGEQFGDARSEEAKTDGDDAAPLDFFPRQKAGAVPDEFADQQFRTTKKAADVAVGPENKMSAMAKAPERGAEIARTLNKDFAAGVAMIESRLRSAQRPEFIADKKARETSAVGGQHYVMPLAYALNADTISKLDLGPAEAKKLTALRGEAAKIILLADKLKENQKVALTKAMAPAASVDKVNLANYAKLLQKASPAAPEVAAAGAPKSQPKPSGAADWSDTGARKLSAMSSEIHNDLERGGFAATHDSPIRHEGKFNWREHTGKGEGNAAFGAGTYLSTGDKVHNFYKKMMTEKVRGEAYLNDPQLRDMNAEFNDIKGRVRGAVGPDKQALVQRAHELSKLMAAREESLSPKAPTYHVSVNAMKAQLLNWDKPLSGQSSYVQKRLEGVVPNDPWGNDDMAALIAGVSDGSSVRIDPAYLRGEGDRFLVRHDGKVVGYFVTEAEAKNGARQALAGQGLTLVASPTGRELYGQLTDELGSQAAASDYLQSLGILGHEYAASNGRDGKTPNYVIYDDSKITTNYVHFNRQGGNARVATQAEMDEAVAYIRKVLGPQIKVEFKDITGYAGEWLDTEQAIQISTTAAPGVLHTAYHEALHGFFSKFVKNDPRALDVLRSLAENDKILARVAALLAGHPAAIDQLKSGEERLAYIYQFWAAGKLDLPMGKPRTLLQKVRKFFRRVLGLVKDSERAVALFEAFHGGQLAEPSAAGKVIARVLDEGTGVLKARRSMDGLTQWLAAKTMPSETVLATSESKAAQALAKEFFTNPGDEDAGKEAEGYLNARRRVAARYNNTFAQAIRGLSDRDLTEVAKLLQDEAELADIPYAPHREAVGKIRGLLQRFYKYMSDERGLELGHAGDKYFPRVWNTHLLHEKKDQFVQMLATHYDAVLEQGAQGSKGKLSKEQVAERIWRALVDREGVNDKLDAQRQDGVLAPFFASKENRTLAWLSGEHVQPFLEKNLVATLSRYFHQGVRAAEYTDRFGADGEALEAKLMEIQGELTELSMAKLQRKEFKDDAARAKWVSRQYRDVAEAVGAMEGTLGKDVSPTVRKLNSWMTVYQNVRLLPLSLFASFVDPLGMVARGATMKEAYDAFLRGMKEVTSNWGDMFREEPKERQADQWEKLAEHVGAVDAALFAHHVSDEYSSVYMERGAKTINDTMFKLNGMEAWNRGMRVAGVKSAVAFIERHAGGADKVHSTRWLEELGLDPKNIPLDTEGKLITDKSVLMQQKGMGKSQAEREIDAVHYAINRWVEGAILTPNAAQRPAWGSDPHYSMFFHLKQFSYSFHQTILKRAVKEMNHGNLAPMGAFVWYIPTMIAADITKGLIQGGGELPAYMKGYDAGDWMMHGVQRAGLLGAGQIGVDAGEDMFSLAGPGVEQMIDAMRDPLSETTIKALPAHGLYAAALR
ncbi:MULTISPECIES: hypothetical protein [unclassified Acidovorax]|uniref:hypothetical protein n=1 Tax=unclassified Acidovorax TaxID=2684926 RepID=UPI000B3FAE0E|nr:MULTISPECIES: hypothetical protein [unclassified Acidovorax]